MKLNLIVDASGIFYRSLFTVGNYGTAKGQKLLQSEESKGVFMRKLATDFSALVRSVDNVSRVIVCLDSSSWRKKILIEDGGYKSSRKKDESTLDWESFFQLTQEFTDILGQKGYILSKVKDAEADDLLFLWAKKLNSQGEAVILVTGDKDLHQVLNLHPNGAWTVALDPVAQRRKVFLTKETQGISHEEIQPGEIDFFDSTSWNSSAGDVLFSLLDKNDVQVVDPVEVATRKVLLGDAGDSVPGIATWKDPKDESKVRSMTEAKLKKVLENLPPVSWKTLRNGENLEELTASLNVVTKQNYTSSEVLERIQRNVTLVVLDEEIIPLQIQESFALLCEKIENSPVHLTRNVLLEGTKWWSEKKPFVPKSYDVTFAGIDSEDPFEISKESSDKDKLALQKALGNIKDKKDSGPSALF